jgi:hypothetical protein
MMQPLNDDKVLTICGRELNKAESFVYDKIGFITHFAKGLRCSKCEKYYNLKKG